MKTVEVKVTIADINAGVPFDSASCPVALAAIRATGLELCADQCGIWHDGRILKATKSASLARFITRFDKRLPVTPFTFILKVPDDA